MREPLTHDDLNAMDELFADSKAARTDHAELKRLRADNARLREALEKHGRHDANSCPYAIGHITTDPSDVIKCTCGLAAALKEPDDE